MAEPRPLLPDALQWLPADGHAEQLMLLLHGWGAEAADMAPLAQTLHQQFPQAVLLAPQGFEPAHASLAGRQWFAMPPADDAALAANALAALPRLSRWVRAAQRVSGLGQQATALVGFSQGATLALALAQAHDGLAGRVLAFGGRYAELPTWAPQATTLHLFHGADDVVVPAQHARQAIERLAALQGDATVDIVPGVGHEIAPALVQAALQRLTSHIPQRTWRAALGGLPPAARRAADQTGVRDD